MEEESPGLTKDEILLLQEDINALLQAWVDRGVHPSDGAVLLMATACVLVNKLTDITVDQIVEVVKERWSEDGE